MKQNTIFEKLNLSTDSLYPLSFFLVQGKEISVKNAEMVKAKKMKSEIYQCKSSEPIKFYKKICQF